MPRIISVFPTRQQPYAKTLSQHAARMWQPVPGLWCGPYPGLVIGQLIKRRKIHAVMNLQQSMERDYNGNQFPDYQQGLPAGICFMRSPIRDMDVPSSQQARHAVATICRWLYRYRLNVYLHCWGGHGRTGTIAGCLLRQIGYNADAAFEIIEQARADKPLLARMRSPQTDAQRNIVRDYLPATF